MTITEAHRAFDIYYLLDLNRSEKTHSEYRTRIVGKNGLLTVTGDIPIEAINPQHILAWKLHMRDQGLQAGYINDCLGSLRWLLKWVGETTRLPVMDYQTIRYEREEQNKPKTLLTPEEVDKLVSVAPSLRAKAIIELLFNSGIRSAELTSLDRWDWEAVTIVNEYDVVHHRAEPIYELQVQGKNQKYRATHFHSRAYVAVQRYLETRDDVYRPLFISQQNRRISYHTISHMLHVTAAKAQLGKVVTQHVFRHSNATLLAVEGMPLPVLAAHLGHKDSVVTQRVYTNEISAIQSRRGYAKFGQALESGHATSMLT